METTALEETLAPRRDVADARDHALTWSESQQVSPVESDLWVDLMEPERQRWEHRAGDASLSRQQQRYAHRRAERLRRPYHARTDACARSGVTVRCGCPGRRDVRWYTCRQHLVCGRCRSRRAKRLGARIRAGLEAVQPGSSPREPRTGRWHMLTLTCRHLEDVGATREALARGWRAFYKMLRRRYPPFVYAGTWEVTPGDDAQGHPHCHVLVFWPWRDWGDIAELWRAACPESTHIRIQVARSTKAAARYLSKYVAKGVEADEFSPELRARVLAGTYGTRWVFTSVRFWVPFTPCCPGCGQRVVPCVSVNPWTGDAAEDPCRWDGPWIQLGGLGGPAG